MAAVTTCKLESSRASVAGLPRNGLEHGRALIGSGKSVNFWLAGAGKEAFLGRVSQTRGPSPQNPQPLSHLHSISPDSAFLGRLESARKSGEPCEGSCRFHHRNMTRQQENIVMIDNYDR